MDAEPSVLTVMVVLSWKRASDNPSPRVGEKEPSLPLISLQGMLAGLVRPGRSLEGFICPPLNRAGKGAEEGGEEEGEESASPGALPGEPQTWRPAQPCARRGRPSPALPSSPGATVSPKPGGEGGRKESNTIPSPLFQDTVLFFSLEKN